MQQINFTGNLEPDGNTEKVFCIIEEAKEAILDVKKSRKNVVTLFCQYNTYHINIKLLNITL